MENDDVVKSIIRTVYDDKGEKEAEQGMDNLSNKAKDAGKKMSSAFSAVKWGVLGAAIKNATQRIAEVTKQSADYIETLNLLQVAFEGNTESIRKFSSQLADTLNLDDSTVLSAAAHFKVLSQSMGLATETGSKLAKLMTQMTLDVSSLYNIDFDKAQSALQYAMEGRGTSLKQRTGVSVLETSVQTTLDVLGIDAYVENMSDAEKAIARVISMEYQLMASQGDLARTIEAPANQMRIMGEQVNMLARNIGNVFLPIVAKILPYLNAILIVLNAIISALARLVGYKEGMFDTFEESNAIDYFDGVSGAIDGVGKSAESAAKKLQGLRGFDKLNVIKTPTDTGKASGGGGGGLGGINPNLLKAFNDMANQYKMKLDGVKTKATEIAEKILTWLGFAKKINKETGKVEWYFKKLTGGTLLGAFGVGGFIYLGISKILGLLKKIGLIKFGGIGDLVKLFKDGTIAKNVATFSTKFSELAAVFGMSAGTFALVAAAIVAIGVALVHAYKTSDEFREKINGMVESLVDLFKTVYDVIQPVLDYFVLSLQVVWEEIKLVIGVAYDFIVYVFSDIADIISGAAKIIKDIINLDFKAAFDDFIDLVKNLHNNYTDFLGKTTDRFKEFFSNVWEKIKDFIPKALEKLGELLEWIKDLPNKFFEFVGEAVGTLIRLIVETDWKELGKDILEGIYKGLVNIVEIGKKTGKFIDETFKKLKESAKDIDWGQVGKSMLDGIINGLFGFQKKINEWANSFVKGIKKGLGINSPSKLILDAKIGDFSMEAITEGMERQLDLVDDEAKNIVDTLEDGMKKATSNTKIAADIMPNIADTMFNSNVNRDFMNSINKDLFASNQGLLAKNSSESSGGLQNATFVIQVGDETIAKKVLKDLNGMAKSDGKPITIRG